MNKNPVELSKRLYRRVRWIVRCAIGKDVYFAHQHCCAREYVGKNSPWCICPTKIEENSIIYSFGVGEDISFDLGMINLFNVKLHAFDPTPRSVKWLKEQKLPNNFFFYPYGLADYDGLMEFYPPSNPNHVSFSIYKHGSYAKKSKMVKAQVYRLKTIMEMLGHSRIDLLKMDIEGAEYAVIRDIIDSNIEIGQLIVEFHHRWKNVGAAKTREAVIILNKNRFKIFNITATGEEYSFLKV